MIIQSSFSEVPPLSDRRVRSMFWDPQNPAALLLPRVENDQFVMERFFADPGIGCNEHELSALIKIVTAHEEYMNIKQNLSYDSSIQPEILLQGHLRDLSTKYRSAVRDCLSDWEMGIEEQLIKSSAQMNDIDDTKKNLDNDYENIQLLQIVYSIMHISDIFLPLLPSANSWDYQVDPYQRPGIATAATVRYLRYHHLDIPEEMLNDSEPDEITEMMNSAHPEQFKKGSVYWEYVRQLVLRGALEKAWNVLSKHSIFVIASSICKDSEGYGRNPTEFAEMTEIYQGFSKLKEIMLRAPLPGGRNENYDDALVSEDCSEDVIEEAFLFMDGLDIVPSDYKFWETAYSTVSNGATTIEHSTVFNEKLAIQKHRQWSEYVKDIRPYFALSKRLRAVDSILAILSGDFSGVNFDTWAQQVCAELLYRHPDSRPAQISKRTRRIVDQFLRDNENSAHINTVVNIMEGDAGNAIELIYASGGAAGAALPATLVGSVGKMGKVYIISLVISPFLFAEKSLHFEDVTTLQSLCGVKYFAGRFGVSKGRVSLRSVVGFGFIVSGVEPRYRFTVSGPTIGALCGTRKK